MSKYKCIIFDCDGVLVDSETIAFSILVDMANELGAKMNKQTITIDFKGRSLNYFMETVSHIIKKPLPDNFEAEYRKLSFKAFSEEVEPIEGVEKVIKKLNIPFCVASSGPSNKIKLNLETVGLLKYFENNIFSCYDIQKWKPDPDIFLWAAKTMGFNPQECLVIEDSLTGIKAAKTGGFDVFGFTAHDFKNELEAEADKTFKNMSELLELLK
jgi:HAD superfamily hydrolase (TIGR01509 family)